MKGHIDHQAEYHLLYSRHELADMIKFPTLKMALMLRVGQDQVFFGINPPFH